MNPNPSTKHKRYDSAFRRSAVEHWLVSGKSGRQIAAELGVNVQTLHRCKFASHAEAKAAIFEWIEVFYNRERLHSARSFQPPVDFETNPN